VSAAPADQLLQRDARRRANTELRLLGLGLVVVVAAAALVAASDGEVILGDLALEAGLLGGLGVGAHLVSRRFAARADPVLLPLAFLLNGFGLVIVRRLAPDIPEQFGGRLAVTQSIWSAVGILAFCATLVVLRDHRLLDRYRYLIGLAALVLLLLPLLPVIGSTVNGARLWLDFRVVRFQPGEVAKLALVAFFASYLAEKRGLLSSGTSRLGPLRVPPARALGPVLVMWVASLVVLVFERDLGLSLLVFAIFVAMLYVATDRLAYPLLAVVLFGSGAYGAWRAFAHVQLRVETWLHPFADPTDRGFQIVQSLVAIGSGGLVGSGLGQGSPERIPVVQSDFVFSAIAEELGLMGAAAVLLCFFLLVAKGFSIAMRASDDFSTLLAAGLTVVLGLQVFVILGGVTRLIPLTGLTLPFMSAGGSSLLSNYVLVAVLVRISAAERS
jgi:cell division protein FtsW (lipid II flippase)